MARSMLLGFAVAVAFWVANATVMVMVQRMELPYWQAAQHALFVAQVCLAGVWLALGEAPFVFRLVVGLMILLTLVVWHYEAFWDPAGFTRWFCLLGVSLALTWVPLAVSRRLGYKFTETARIELRSGTLRFSVTDLLLWMPVAAVVLFVVRWVLQLKPPLVGILFAPWPTDASTMLALGTAYSVTALAAFRAALGERVTLSLGVLCLTTLVTAAVLERTGCVRRIDMSAMVLVTEAVVVLCSLFVFRLAGYRFGRIPRE